jgi:hypothetical protein
MISTRGKPTRRTARYLRRDPGAPEIIRDSARLSAILRDLAIRAHRTASARADAVSSPAGGDLIAELDRDLTDLLVQIRHLERSLLDQSLDALVPYVAALRQKVASLVPGP